jgi:chaperonin GroES
MKKHMNLKPILDYLIVKPLEEELTTKSGIVIPDTNDKDAPERGEVMAVGTGKRMENGQIAEPLLKVGQKVLFKKYAPEKIKENGVDYLVIRESDVMLIIE